MKICGARGTDRSDMGRAQDRAHGRSGSHGGACGAAGKEHNNRGDSKHAGGTV
jgi:hypothetical protein